MNKLKTILTISVLTVVSSGANAALVERLGGLAYYDEGANLTWLADANYAQTNGYDADGLMTWDDANTWAADLSVGGNDEWRLATADVNCGSSCSNEMGSLYSAVAANPGYFSNVQSDYYWLATEYDSITGWMFRMEDGAQGVDAKAITRYAWAVQTGDVSAVPVPAAAWLFGSALLGLAGIGRRKKV